MKKHFYLLFILALVACKQDEVPQINVNGSTISIEEGETILNNLYYQNIGNGKVLAINKIENIDDSLEIPMNIITPVLPKSDSAKWQINFAAQSFEISRNYITTESFIEGKEYTYALYNLANGNKILDYTYDKFEVLFTNENERRIIGFYTKNAINREKSGLKFNDKTLAYFFYVNDDGEINHLRLDVKDVNLIDKYDISNTNVGLFPLTETGFLRFNSNKSLFFTSLTGENKNEINFDVEVTLYSFDPYEPYTLKLKVENDLLKFNEDDLKETDFVLVSN